MKRKQNYISASILIITDIREIITRLNPLKLLHVITCDNNTCNNVTYLLHICIKLIIN